MKPITCREKAAKAAIIGSIRTKTIVLAGTPSLTIVRMANEMKLFQERDPIGCSSSKVLSGDFEASGSVRSAVALIRALDEAIFAANDDSITGSVVGESVGVEFGRDCADANGVNTSTIIITKVALRVCKSFILV